MGKLQLVDTRPNRSYTATMEQHKDYFVRLDAELARRVKELAKQERRSIRAEFEVLIERGLEAFERERERTA